MSQWIVLKFGGTSVARVETWQFLLPRITAYQSEGLRPLIVCSALSGVSDLLAELLATLPAASYQPIIDKIKALHLSFSSDLNVCADTILADEFELLSRLALGVHLTQVISPALEARVMALGELMLTKLVSAYLIAQSVDLTWLDARDYLRAVTRSNATDAQNILSASCDFLIDNTLLETLTAHSGVLLTQGFIAANDAGETVLLGRGGSDTSAAYFAAKLGAVRCEIWTDVPGIYTANPHMIPAAKLINRLTFDEAREIAATGAKVLHPRCLDPLAHQGIPLSVHCTANPDMPGTKISDNVPLVDAQVKAVSLKTGIVVVSMETTMMWHEVGFLAKVFACFERHHLSVDLLATSENNVTVTLDLKAPSFDSDILSALSKDLSQFCTVNIIKPCAAVSLVGRNIRSVLYQLAPVFEVFKEQKIYLLTQATNDLNLTVVLDETCSEQLLHKIHALLFESPAEPKQFGPSWQNTFPHAIADNFWWYKKRDSLLDLLGDESGLYVYDSLSLKQQADQLNDLSEVDRFFYAIKANDHPGILRIFYDAGLGFECVSAGELAHVFALFPDIDPARILFTPNFSDESSYQLAFEKKVYVNVDNLHPLLHWGAAFAGQSVLLRIDPGLGRGHHKYVQTGGSHSKFGISLSDLPELKALLLAHNVTVIGLHVHFGSGVMSEDSWYENAIFLAKLLPDFPDVRILDLGGGLGVPEKFGQRSLDLNTLNKTLLPIKEAYPTMALWLEPGRYLVAESGVLLARVTQLKHKNDVDYIGVSTGMNSLIRPSLYSAYHEIVNLSAIEKPRKYVAHIVGPICETGDTLGYSRAMPETEEGDVVLIANAGAYGRVMSSNYNRQEPAKEVLLTSG